MSNAGTCLEISRSKPCPNLMTYSEIPLLLSLSVCLATLSSISLATGGKRRTIEAVLDRMMLEVVSETGTMLVPAVTVKVRNDAVYGISSRELDTGRDKIVLAFVYGDDPEPRQIARRMSDDGGFLVLLVQ